MVIFDKINIRWIALGVLLIVVGIGIGTSLVENVVIRTDPKLRKAAQRIAAIDPEKGQTLPPKEKAKLRRLFLGNAALVSALIAMFLILPLAVGLGLGFFTHSVRDGAVAVGAGLFIAMIVNGQLVYGVIAGGIYAGIGALTAFGGKKWALRRQLTEK